MSHERGEALEAGLLGLAGYLCFSYYEVVGRLAGRRGVDWGFSLRTPLDDAVPYLPVFVLPYALAFVLPAAVAVAVWVHGGLPAMRRAFAVYLALLALHFALFLAFPTSASGIMLPETSLGTGALAAAVRFFYRLAPPWNACPSFHIAGGWFFYRVLGAWAPRASRAYLVWFWLMAAGTAFIKIHWVLDGAAGLLLAEAFYRWGLAPAEARGALAWPSPPPRALLAAFLPALLLLGAGLMAALIPSP